jgi:hypothetical protein
MVVFALAAAREGRNGVILLLAEERKILRQIAKVRDGPLLSPPWVS